MTGQNKSAVEPNQVERERERKYWVRERQASSCANGCMCVRERVRERDQLCVKVCERKRERECTQLVQEREQRARRANGALMLSHSFSLSLYYKKLSQAHSNSLSHRHTISPSLSYKLSLSLSLSPLTMTTRPSVRARLNRCSAFSRSISPYNLEFSFRGLHSGKMHVNK